MDLLSLASGYSVLLYICTVTEYGASIGYEKDFMSDPATMVLLMQDDGKLDMLATNGIFI